MASAKGETPSKRKPKTAAKKSTPEERAAAKAASRAVKSAAYRAATASTPKDSAKSAAKSAANSEKYKAAHAEWREIHPPANPKVVQGDKPRPSEYTLELGTRICIMFATDPSMTMIKLNTDPELPTVYKMYEWLRDDAHFAKCFAQAREIQAELQADELELWASRPLLGEVETRRAGTTEKGHIDVTELRTHDNVERAKLMVATRQWRLGKLHPKRFGNKEPDTTSGPNEQLDALFAALKKGPVEDE